MALNLMALNDNKAGMAELDKERINAIILENSKGSKFFENQQRKTQQLQKRIEEKLALRDKISPAMVKKGEAEADVIIRQIETERNLSRNILHIDMDAFYAAVEMRDQPALRSKPMAVGGMSMLSTSNYVARRFGVRAAMPGFIAKKLCPDLTIVPCDFPKYTEASREVRSLLALYDPDFAPMSLDEAYLDLTEHLRGRAAFSEAERTFGNRHVCRCGELNEEARSEAVRTGPEAACRTCMAALDGTPRTFGLSFWEAARELRWRIFDATQLTASAGLAPNCLLAKVASDRRKPNGQFEVGASEDDIALFIRALPVRKVPGIGNVSEQMLKALGITTCADIYDQRGLLFHLCTACNFRYYLRVAMGDGDSFVSNDGERKSMSVERTFPEIKKAAELLEKCHELSDALAQDLRDARMKGRTVTLKVKLVTFELRTRAQTLPQVTRDAEAIFAAAAELLRNEINAAFPELLRLRLMGVRMSGLVSDDMIGDSTQQLSLERAFKASKTQRKGSGKGEPSAEKAPIDLVQESSKAEPNQKPSGFFEKFHKEKAHRFDGNKTEDASSSDLVQNSVQESSKAEPNQKPSGFFEKFHKEKAHRLAEDNGHNEADMTTCLPQDSAMETSRSSPPLRTAPPLRKKERVQRPDSPVFSGTCSALPCGPQPGEAWSGFPCPVCGRVQLVQDERQFHAHLDFCLSRGAITEAIREAEEAAPPPKRSKPNLKGRSSAETAPLLKYFSKTNS